MKTYCGLDCGNCSLAGKCGGCVETCGKPFGGSCVAAEIIKLGGRESFDEFKLKLLEEINGLLKLLGYPAAPTLFQLSGSFVNLSYPLPDGQSKRFLDDTKIYMGCQIELDGLPRCVGVVADTTFILISTYGENGTDPEIALYKAR